MRKMIETKLTDRLKSFIESEGKSCSFAPELITSLYVYRMWGGQVPLEEIEHGLAKIRRQGYMI